MLAEEGPPGLFHATAHGSWQAPALRLDDLAVTSGSTRITAKGQATAPFDLTAKVQSPDLAALYPDLGGSLDLDLKLSGPLDDPLQEPRRTPANEPGSEELTDALLSAHAS